MEGKFEIRYQVTGSGKVAAKVTYARSMGPGDIRPDLGVLVFDRIDAWTAFTVLLGESVVDGRVKLEREVSVDLVADDPARRNRHQLIEF